MSLCNETWHASNKDLNFEFVMILEDLQCQLQKYIKRQKFRLKYYVLHGESESNLLIALNLLWWSADLRGHLNDGKTQFLPSNISTWLVSFYIS